MLDIANPDNSLDIIVTNALIFDKRGVLKMFTIASFWRDGSWISVRAGSSKAWSEPMEFRSGAEKCERSAQFVNPKAFSIYRIPGRVMFVTPA